MCILCQFEKMSTNMWAFPSSGNKNALGQLKSQ